MRDLLRVLRLGGRHGAWFVLAVVSMVVVAGATVFAFNLVRPIYDQVLRPTPVEGGMLEHRPGGFVGALDEAVARIEADLRGRVGGGKIVILALALLAVVVRSLFAFLARFASARFGLATIRDLRNELFESVLVKGPAYFHGRSTAGIVSRATNDLQLLREALAERLGDVAQDLVAVPALVVYLLFLDLRLTLATVVVAPLLFAPVVHFSRKLRERARRAQERTEVVAALIDETVRGIRVVQNFGMARFMTDRFHRANREQYVAGLGARVIQAANGPVMEVVGSVAALALVGYATLHISAGDMTLGDFSAFVLCAYAVYNPLKRLNKFNLVLQHALVAARRIYEIIDAPIDVTDRPGARPLSGIDGGIRFEDVGFAYREGRWVLRCLDLEVPYGSTVALVGASGAGKSTAVQLISRFFDVAEGRVRIGDLDVRDIQLESLRSRIGLVTQETILFDDTVGVNIVCGREGISTEAVEAAARAADADNFIRDLPAGYDTVVGEGGAKLSGGQRQRLALARAILTDPPILILDEATAALDSQSEALIHEALRRSKRVRTTLVITHRLATIRDADLIAVLEDGRIAERGTHAELLARGGRYRRMVEKQELS